MAKNEKPMGSSYGHERGDLSGAKYCGRVDVYDKTGKWLAVHWASYVAPDRLDQETQETAETVLYDHYGNKGRIVDEVETDISIGDGTTTARGKVRAEAGTKLIVLD